MSAFQRRAGGGGNQSSVGYLPAQRQGNRSGFRAYHPRPSVAAAERVMHRNWRPVENLHRGGRNSGGSDTQHQRRMHLHRARCGGDGGRVSARSYRGVRARRCQHGHKNLWWYHHRPLVQGGRRAEQCGDAGLLQQGPRWLPGQCRDRRMVQPRSRMRGLQPEERLHRDKAMELSGRTFPEDGPAVLRRDNGRPHQMWHQHDAQHRHGARRGRQHPRHGFSASVRGLVLRDQRGSLRLHRCVDDQVL